MSSTATSSLDDLLGGSSVEEFVQSIWSRRPCVFRSAEAFRARLPTIDLGAVLSAPPGRLKAGYEGVHGEHVERAVDTPEEAEAAFASGKTLCYPRISADVPEIEQLCADIKRELGTGGEVYASIYASPPGGGFGLHFDCKHVFIVQMVGSKSWRYSAAGGVANPPCNLAAQSVELFNQQYPWAGLRRPTDEQFTRRTLAAGDVLYLPPGTWHVANACEVSIGLTVAVLPLTASALVAQWIHDRTVGLAAWREDLPLARRRAFVAGALPADLETFLGRRIEELREILAQAGPPSLQAIWARRASPASGMNVEPRVEPMLPTDRLRVRAEVYPRYARELCHGFDSVIVTGGRSEIRLPWTCEPFIASALRQREFQVMDALQWPSADTLGRENVRAILESLLRHGVLARVR